MNPATHTRLKKVLISLVITIGLCILLINGVEAQSKNGLTIKPNGDLYYYSNHPTWTRMVNYQDSLIAIKDSIASVVYYTMNNALYSVDKKGIRHWYDYNTSKWAVLTPTVKSIVKNKVILAVKR